MVNFSILPDSIIHLILSYSDSFVFRFGKYMGRIQKKDNRYDIIHKRKIPIIIGNNKLLFKFIFYDSFNVNYLIMEEIHNNHHYLIKKKVLKDWDDTLIIVEQTKYIFDLNGNCRKMNDYVM